LLLLEKIVFGGEAWRLPASICRSASEREAGRLALLLSVLVTSEPVWPSTTELAVGRKSERHSLDLSGDP
jgi:hypothetical protein